MQTLQIDRLVLNVSGLTQEEAQRLAMRVSEGLAAANIPRMALENPGAIRLDLRPHSLSEQDPDTLAEQIVSGIVHELSRSA